MPDKSTIILASASPRRGELLAQIGVTFQRQVADLNENQLAGETADEYVMRLALEKARAVHRQLGNNEAPVLGADTTVVVDGEILGKPIDREHFRTMLHGLSGCSHRVFTAVAMVASHEQVLVSETEVHFRRLSDLEIDAYWQTGEPCDKAGGYAIQGLATMFIEKINGSYSGVMGLPLFETVRLLENFGITVMDGTR